MQIQLCEDDGDFHEGGIPQLVVLVVKFDDGKQKRIPYPAEKSIAALYQDLKAIASKVSESTQRLVIDEIQLLEEIKSSSQYQVKNFSEGLSKENKQHPAAKEDKSNVIEKEDIITLIKLNPRDTVYSGTMSPLIVGMDYRVLAVLGPKIPTPDGKGIRTVVQGYEVIDDHAPTPERMIVTPDEVQLKSKRLSKIIEKVSVVEEVLPCPACQVNNPLILKGNDFVGNCTACGVDISIARIISNCQTPGCKKDGVKVSCFDVGGKYEGQCGSCRAKIEVPYV